MTKRLTSMSKAVVVLMFVYGAAGCDSLVGPFTSSDEMPQVTDVIPPMGVVGSTFGILGEGFARGATVTLGGIAADVLAVREFEITAATPVGAAGTVDLVVRNRNGRRTVLAEAFTFVVVSLTTNANVVAPGGQLSVTWTASSGQPFDWVGLFEVGDGLKPWAEWGYLQHNTNGALTGTWHLTAPKTVGEYEFRFAMQRISDDFAARSTPVVVK